MREEQSKCLSHCDQAGIHSDLNAHDLATPLQQHHVAPDAVQETFSFLKANFSKSDALVQFDAGSVFREYPGLQRQYSRLFRFFNKGGK